MDHVISMEVSGPSERLEELKARYDPTPDNQQQLGDDDLNKIMDRELYEATKEGDVEKFIDALEKVSESRKLALSLIFNQIIPLGNSLLHLAASSGSEHLMELILINYPYLVTRKNSSEDTPLHVAVRTGSVEATRKLIRLRRDSEIMYWKNKDGKSPLYLAVENCESSECENRRGASWEILQLLLQESARDETYAVEIQGKSPVLAALEEKKSDILQEIIDRLPKLLHVPNEDGGTPVHSAASAGNVKAVKFLLSKCPYLALRIDKNGSYPIHIACEASNSDSFKTLLDYTWPDLAEIKNKKGQNVLHVAAKAGKVDTVSSILDHPNIEKLANSKDADGTTPLHLALMHDNLDLVHKIYPQSTSLDLAEIKNNKGQNVLHVAAKAGKVDTVSSILVHPNIEKLVNSKDADGNTPLHLASMHNHGKVLSSLTNHKSINLQLLNNAQWTALDVAQEPHSLSVHDPALKGREILIKARVQRRKQSCVEWVHGEINTRLVVATLVASVTFTAGLTLPGGINASSDPHPGMATMLHNDSFKLFVLFDTVAMYSSILAVVILLWGYGTDIDTAVKALRNAGVCLYMACGFMAVAFVAALSVALEKRGWFPSLVGFIALLFVFCLLRYLVPFVFRQRPEVTRLATKWFKMG